MNVITRYDFANSRYILKMSANKNDLNISEQEWIEYLRTRNEYDKMQKWVDKLAKKEKKELVEFTEQFLAMKPFANIKPIYADEDKE